jgi:glycosyltransferase involved in cell wall biosynthesis
MARFILVDSSIKAPGGHHFEYAARILDAAKAEGYQTLLLAHKTFDKARWPISHDVKAAFTHTFWEHFVHYYVKKEPRRISLRPRFLFPLVRFWRRQVLLFRFSRSGLAYERARNYTLREIATQGFTTHDLSALPSSRLGMILARVTIVMRGLAISAFEYAKRLAAMVGRGLRFLLLAIAAPFAVVLAPLFLVRPKRDPARAFAAELDNALRLQKRSAEDVLFIPNATTAELRALALMRARCNPNGDLHWAFLFRRPVFEGYEEDYQRQGEAARLHRMQFAALRRVAPNARVSFHTDTDELTEQYNRLGVYKFHTLPVPVDPGLGQRETRSRNRLVIGYIGDARDEKGFQHLPRLVDYLDSDAETSGRVTFLFQSNFNIPEGEPETRHAKRLLQDSRPDLVELVEGPFNQREYAALAQRMDVLLIPYYARQYSARSSGVLAEAIAAGIPSVAPARTSMAALVESFRQAHLKATFEQAKPGGPRLIASEDIVRRAGRTRRLRMPPDARYLLISVDLPEAPDRYISIRAEFHSRYGVPLVAQSVDCWATGTRVLAGFEIPRGQRVAALVEATGLGVLERASKVCAHFYDSEQSVPLFAGVALFEAPERDFLTATREVVVHYEHHRRAAERLRVELESFHSPAELVRRLRDQVRRESVAR